MAIHHHDTEKILEVITDMSREGDYSKLLEDILGVGMEVSNSDGGTLYLLKEDELRFFYMITKSKKVRQGGRGKTIDLPPVPLDSVSVASLCAREKRMICVADVYNDEEYNWSGPKTYDEMTGYHTQSVLVLPLFDKEKNVLGVMQLINAQDEDGNVIPFSTEVAETVFQLSTLCGILLNNITLYDNIKGLLDSFINAMIKAIESRTPFNASHTVHVAYYCGAFIDYLNKHGDNIPKSDREQLVMAAMLHDIGKMIVKEEILNKATRFSGLYDGMMVRYDLIECWLENQFMEGLIEQPEYQKETAFIQEVRSFISRLNGATFLLDEDKNFIEKIRSKSYVTKYGVIHILTEEELNCAYIKTGTLTAKEREEIQRHVVYTNEILDQLDFGKQYEDVRSIAANHHEFLDGSGYPNHLKNDQLSKYARIITISDIYDSLVAADRPYKKPMPNEKALAILREMADEGKLDKQLVESFSDFRSKR